jgi:hypothetical protein
MECTGGTTLCGSECVDTTLDPGNCGGCANVPNAGDHICASGEVCSSGSCGIECTGGTTLCGSECVDTTLDPGNCGGCANVPNAGDHICAAGEVCSSGSCGVSCGGGTTLCGTECVDISIDPGNCGGCANDPNPGDNICGAGEVCSAGGCDVSCGGGTTLCGTECVDTNFDPGNCGGCANDPNPGDHICLAGEVCNTGTCDVSCGGGTTLCGTECVDTNLDPGNCGGCANDPNPGDHICPSGESCDTGTCVLECTGGTTLCGSACVDTRYDPGNCGGCADDPNPGDNVCPTATNADAVCANGTCYLVCQAGYDNCDADWADGCEIDILNNPLHCNACNSACPIPAHSSRTCSGGACGITCLTGWDNCDGNDANGCEQSTSANFACGGCTAPACSSGQVCYQESCCTGMCVVMVAALNEAWNGNLGGLANADAMCATQAAAAGYTGTWKALLSTTTQNMSTLITGTDATTLPVTNIYGEQLFTSWDYIFNTSQNFTTALGIYTFAGAKVDEGTVSPGFSDADVWSGSDATGTFVTDRSCLDWNSSVSTDLGYAAEYDMGYFAYEGGDHACNLLLAVGCVRTAP